MLNPVDILEKAQKNVERQIILLKEELKAESSAKAQGRQNGSIPDLEEFNRKLNKKIEDAPKDSKQYARENGSWVEVQGGSGGSSVEHFTCPVIALIGNDVPAGRTAATFTDINTAFKAGKTCILDVCRTIQATGTVTIQEYRLTSSCVDAGYLFGCIATKANGISEMGAIRVELGNTWTCKVDTSFKTYSLHVPDISNSDEDVTFYSKPESVTPTSVEEMVWFDSINVKPELTLTYLDGSDTYHHTTAPFWDAVYEYPWIDEETGLTWNCKEKLYEFKVNSSYTPDYSMPGSKFNFSVYMYVSHSVCENGEEENYYTFQGYVRRDQMNTIDSEQLEYYSFNEIYYLLYLGNLRIINEDRCKQDYTYGEFYVKSVICNSASPDEDHDFSLILCSDVKTGFTNGDSLQARGNPYITVSKWDYNGTTKTWDASPSYDAMYLAGVTAPTVVLHDEWKMALFVAHGGILANYSHPYNGAYRFSQVLDVTSYPQNSDYYFDCIWVDNSDQTIPAQQWPMYYERVVVHYDENGEITTPEGSTYGVKTLYKAALTHTVYP